MKIIEIFYILFPYTKSLKGILHGLPRWFNDKECTCKCRRSRFNPWVGKIPWTKKMAPDSSILAWKILRTEEPGRL